MSGSGGSGAFTQSMQGMSDYQRGVMDATRVMDKKVDKLAGEKAELISVLREIMSWAEQDDLGLGDRETRIRDRIVDKACSLILRLKQKNP